MIMNVEQSYLKCTWHSPSLTLSFEKKVKHILESFLGGHIAWKLAEKHPELFSKVIFHISIIEMRFEKI